MDKPQINLTVKDIVEHEDGSATVIFDFNVEATKFLIEHAILDILTKAAQKGDQ